MKLLTLLTVQLTLAAALVADRRDAEPSLAAQGPKMMVVGDSISHGAEGDFTWRYRLWDWLRKGYKVEFVGPWTGTHGPVDPKFAKPLPPPFSGQSDPVPTEAPGIYDRDVSSEFTGSGHAAWWGRQAAQSKTTIKGWVEEHKPDYLLMLIGFNDLGWFVQGPDSLVGDLGGMVQSAREAKPDIRILLGNVVEREFLNGREDLVENTRKYNEELRERMKGWWRNESPIFYVDVATNYRCRPEGCPDGYDGLHPNAMGEYHIAEAFARVLKNDFALKLEDFSVPESVPQRNLEVPQDVKVNDRAEGFEVTWRRIEGARGYDLRIRGKGNDVWWSDGAVNPNTFTSWFNWAAPGETWEFQVRTRGDNGKTSDYSPLIESTAHPKTSLGPIDIKVFPKDDGIQFEWSADTGYNVNRYAVYVWDKDANTGIQIYATESTSYFAGGLTRGHRYSTFVQTWNNIEQSDGVVVGGGRPRGARDVYVGSTGTPEAPKITIANLDALTVRITWNEVSGSVGYQVYYRNKDDGGPWQIIGTATTTSFETGSLFPGTWNYEFVVSAFNGDNESPKSSAVVPPIYPGYEPPSAPPAPQHLRIANIDATTVRLDWYSSENVLGYAIYIRNVNDGAAFSHAGTTMNTFENVAFLFPGTWNFEFCITAYNGKSESPRTASCVRPFIWPGYATIGTTPDPPSGVMVSNLDANTVRLQWTQMKDVTGYSVYVKSLADNSLSHQDVTTSLKYDIGFPFPGTWNFLICVTAYRDRAESPYSCVRPNAQKRDGIPGNSVAVPVGFTLLEDDGLHGGINATIALKKALPGNVGDATNTGDSMMTVELQYLFKKLIEDARMHLELIN